jgi:predicted heme/steroid binding protein/uncharacterized membrane protein
MREFTPEELAGYDGKEGRPAYVAHEGRVFDLTASERWKNGGHMRRHEAGADLSAELRAAPHGPERLDAFPQVGVVRRPSQPPPSRLDRLLARFPRLRRHPHPMTVHFPLVFAIAAPVFALLQRATEVPAFATTAQHCLWALVLSTPVAILTGYFAWKVNYLGKPLRPVKIKVRLAYFLWGLSLLLAIWGARSPQARTGTLYLLFLCTLAPVATALGWYGGQLTFPVETKR